jgi:hypothetical protein
VPPLTATALQMVEPLAVKVTVPVAALGVRVAVKVVETLEAVLA